MPSSVSPVLSDPGYEEHRLARSQDPQPPRVGSVNTLFQGLYYPGAILLASSVQDIISAVGWAEMNNITVTARSGGHAYDGCSLVDGGLVVDVTQLDKVEILPGGIARVEAGVRHGQLYATLADQGWALPAGTCSTVGIAGLALGGGHGVFAREHGLTIDRVLNISFVTTDGLRTVSQSSDPELFWGLRGGGHNLAGIVTEFHFQLVRSHGWTFYKQRRGWDSEALLRWQRWAHSEPAASWHAVHIMSDSEIDFLGLYSEQLGPPEFVQDRINDGLGVFPGQTFLRSWSWAETFETLDWAPDNEPHPWLAKSFYIDPENQLNMTALDTMREYMRTPPGGVTPQINIDAYGGEISKIQTNATAFPHRNAICSVQMISRLTQIADEKEAKDWLRKSSGKLAQWQRGSYINYADQLGGSRDEALQSYFGSNLPRLRSIANKYTSTYPFNLQGRCSVSNASQ